MTSRDLRDATDSEVGELLTRLADSLEEHGRVAPRVIREGAHRLLTRDDDPRADLHERGCAECGEPVEPSTNGRPRDYCSARCRKRAERSRKRHAVVP